MSTRPGHELARLYADAVYVVDWGRRGLRLVPGERVPRWPLHFGAQTAAFITACNPGSELVGEVANAAAMAALRSRIAHQGLRWLEGEGRSPSGDWPAEASLLVLGISADEAQCLALDFRQNALLLVDATGAVSLAFTPLHATSC